MKAKDLKKILARQGISEAQWKSLNDAQRAFLAKAEGKVAWEHDKAFKAMEDTPEPSINDIGKDNQGKRRGPTGPRTGDAMGAKPLVRKLLGTKDAEGKYPLMSVTELCEATKKSDVNIRTILSDLRSPKYCGSGGVFMTEAIKDGATTKYLYKEPAGEPQSAPSA